MGKIRTRIVGDTEVEKQQKEEQKQRSQEKKLEKKKVHLAGMKGGERTVAVEVDESSLEKMEKAKKILEEKTSHLQGETASKPKKKPISAKPRGKKYKKARELVDKTRFYAINDAIELLKEMKLSKFDESVELHLNVDEAGLKGEVELPHSTGKTVKVAVVNDSVLANIEKGKIDFDILVTHPSFMPKLARFAKVLGPKGLMPNPKAGTISANPEEVVKKFSKGVLRWKTEPKFPLIHQMIGKISFETKALAENAEKLINVVGKTHVKKAVIKSTMSPSIKLEVEKV
jgi:large subunit ribosomal protein L1